MIATDLLKESVDRLNINSQNSDFRKNASGVIAAMLEARMVKKQQNGSSQKLHDPELLPPPPPPPSTKKMHDPEMLPPPPPLPSTKPPCNGNSHNIMEMQDLPLPPPPSPCKIPASILTPPLSSDENDFPQKTRTGSSSSGDDERVNYRHKKQHQHSVNKPELSTHARDRRSYIERNNNNNCSEMSVHGGGGAAPNGVDKETLDSIATGIANGQHPVCDKCKCKITRYVSLRMTCLLLSACLACYVWLLCSTSLLP
jgi:hypothetical protein